MNRINTSGTWALFTLQILITLLRNLYFAAFQVLDSHIKTNTESEITWDAGNKNKIKQNS